MKLKWLLTNNSLSAEATPVITLVIVPAENPNMGCSQFHLYPYSGSFQHTGLCTGSLTECMEAAQAWTDSLEES